MLDWPSARSRWSRPSASKGIGWSQQTASTTRLRLFVSGCSMGLTDLPSCSSATQTHRRAILVELSVDCCAVSISIASWTSEPWFVGFANGLLGANARGLSGRLLRNLWGLVASQPEGSQASPLVIARWLRHLRDGVTRSLIGCRQSE